MELRGVRGILENIIPSSTGAGKDECQRREQSHRDREVRGDHEWVQCQLDRHRAEQGGDHDENTGDSSRTEHSSASSDALIAPPHEGGDEKRQDHDRQGERDVSMGDLDYEIHPVVRGKPFAEAFRPVIAAPHSGPGDTDDRAEHDLRERQDQGGQRPPSQRLHGSAVSD